MTVVNYYTIANGKGKLLSSQPAAVQFAGWYLVIKVLFTLKSWTEGNIILFVTFNWEIFLQQKDIMLSG